ncbi:MAG: phosphoadenosine phosphosulfate reductase family protein [Chitinophagaceae bacterium]
MPVYFINTGYNFPETIDFKDYEGGLFNIKVVDLHSQTPKFMQKGQDGKLLFTSDPDFCCNINKTQPREVVLPQFDIWINGVRAEQSAARKAMKVEQAAPFNRQLAFRSNKNYK